MRNVAILSVAIVLAFLAGCSSGGATPAAVPQTAPVEQVALPAGLFVETAPADAKPLAEVKKAAKKGDSVVVRAVIRGIKSAFVPGRAIVQIADESVPACAMNPDRPWDLHCESAQSLAANTATVQIAGPDGKVLKRGLQGTSGLEHSAIVIVKGTVSAADAQGNLVIDATEVFVEKRKG